MAGRVDSERPSPPAEIRLPSRRGMGRPEREPIVWILSYAGPEGFEARDSAYYDSPDRKSMKPDPAPLIEKAESWFVTGLDETGEG